jgi:hypothetical protein
MHILWRCSFFVSGVEIPVDWALAAANTALDAIRTLAALARARDEAENREIIEAFGAIAGRFVQLLPFTGPAEIATLLETHTAARSLIQRTERRE